MAKRNKSKEVIENIDLTANTGETEQSIPSSGLGDVVAKLTAAFGLTPCDGCKSRQASLNKLFPFLTPSRDLLPDEVKFINNVNSKTSMNNDEANMLFFLYNDIFPSRSPIKRCNCPGLIMKLIHRLHTYANINN